jgi:uncharacterized damage-inducible protein DinB
MRVQSLVGQQRVLRRAHAELLRPVLLRGKRMPDDVVPIAPAAAGGESAILPRWRIFQHLVLHGMQHHTELAQLLTAKGQSPGDIDFVFYD